MKPFAERLEELCESKKTRVCIGLDPRFEWLPSELSNPRSDRKDRAEAYRAFSVKILDAAGPFAAAVKPQSAFFEVLGAPGVEAFESVCREARKRGLLVIADVKRGDIGTTAEAYAEAFLASDAGASPLADACTVNAYLGSDGVRPFIDTAVRENGGIFVLVKTSNPSSGEIQDRRLESGATVAEHVAALVKKWNAPRGSSGYGPVGAVVGATYPAHVATLRTTLEGSVILLPGYGAQGATAADAVQAFDGDGRGALVTASRSLTFPWGTKSAAPQGWEALVENAARAMRDEINAALRSRK